MNYVDKIRELEVQYEDITRKLSQNPTNEEVSALLDKRTKLFEQLRSYRRLHHEAQFVMNNDEYDY